MIGIFLTGMGLLMWVFPETNVFGLWIRKYGKRCFSLAPYVFMFFGTGNHYEGRLQKKNEVGQSSCCTRFRLKKWTLSEENS